jgi:2-polyprenyl-3-methyl-5-hydroxy-6-metoxy-1,4-benzoquinol methylase
MNDKKAMTIDTYDKVASKYNELYSDIYYMEELNKFINLLNNKDLVLDVGCGNGLVSDYLERSGMNVTAIDTSQSMLDISKKRNNKISYFKMDVRDLNFRELSFNAIFCYAVLIHIDKLETFKVLEQFYKLLKPNGILFINVMEEKEPDENMIVVESLDNRYKTWFQYYNKKELINLLKGIGFSIIETSDRIFDDEEYKNEVHCYLRNEFSIYAKKE